jgi:ribose 1,5-bisphosphokinase
VSWHAHGLCYGIPAVADVEVRNGRVVVANVSRGVLDELAERYRRLVVVLARADPALGHRVDATIRNDGSLADGGTQLVDVIRDAARTRMTACG